MVAFCLIACVVEGPVCLVVLEVARAVIAGRAESMDRKRVRSGWARAPLALFKTTGEKAGRIGELSWLSSLLSLSSSLSVEISCDVICGYQC